MDQIKIGKFIGALRRRNGLTQEALGEKIGVTNKTISRWENGNYMPDIEMLQLLAEEFNISINELLVGKEISDEQFRSIADENIIALATKNSFSLGERKIYFKKKWRKEHISLFVIFMVILIFTFIFPFLLHKSWLLGFVPLIAIIGYGFQNNKMMSYVENHLYGLQRRGETPPREEK